MTMIELLPLLSRLNPAEKLHIIQCLISELAQDESDLLRQGMSYPVWSPYDAFEAADTMLKVLATENSTDVEHLSSLNLR
jgi:hypothetical protein